MKLLVATTNANKLREIEVALAGTNVATLSLADFPPIPEPDETGSTFWENARQKATVYARHSGVTTVAEDSGLEILALGGEPGVKSARFLGATRSYPDRFDEIYRRLAARPGAPRDARFVTAVAVAEPDGTFIFEREAFIDGEIAETPVGSYGFGYDPIFLYVPLGKTTAELTIAEKTAVSHRARAFRDLARWAATRPPRESR